MPLPNGPCIPLPGSFFRPESSANHRPPGIDWDNIRYDPQAKKIYVGKIEVIGPKTQVLPEDMPQKWAQWMMGFLDIWNDGDAEGIGECDVAGEEKREEVGDDVDEDEDEDENMKDVRGKVSLCPREEYVRMWITCDAELYMARLGDILTKVEKLLDGLEQRETTFVRAGAEKKEVDDMLEYSVRLTTGADVLQDEEAALRILRKITQGQFPRDKIAIAHNMLCYLHKKGFAREAILENLGCMLVSANFAAASGPFTHCIFTFAHLFAPLRLLQPYNSFAALWTKYEEYKEKWGLVDPAQKVCAVCGTKPSRRRDLKRCAGSCLMRRKPTYCGKTCQRKHWPTHKQWCGKDFTPTESDLESDMYYTDIGSEDEDEDDFYLSSSEDDFSSQDEENTSDNKGDTDRGYHGPLLKQPQLDNDDGDDDDEEGRFSDEEEADESFYDEDHDSDHHSLASDSKPSSSGQALKKKRVWGDYGDIDYFGFVMHLARSVVRLRNT